MGFDPNNPTASGMVLTFDDEFNKVSWSDDGPAQGTLWTDHAINPGPTNGIGDISSSQLGVHDGVLDITAQRDASGNWTSGVLSSVNSSVQGFTPKFGYFEADIQIPAGKGAWPAWWLYSADHFTDGAAPSELDIMENAGSDTTNFGATIHDGTGSQNPNPILNAEVDLSQGFHRYGLLWDPNFSNITWYLDGKEVLTEPKYSSTDAQQMMMTLNLAMGDFGGGGPDGSTPDTMHMLTDYVRVYQFAGQGATAVQPDAVSPAAGNTDPVALANALGQSGSTPASGSSAPPALTPSFQDADGHDIFVFNSVQSGAHIANFHSGDAGLDLVPLLAANGYTGTDPLADHVISLAPSGTDSTAVTLDATGHDPAHATTVVTLDHVLPKDVAATDFWH